LVYTRVGGSGTLNARFSGKKVNIGGGPPTSVSIGDGVDTANIHNATATTIDDVATNDGVQTASLLYGYDNTGMAETWRALAVNNEGELEVNLEVSDIQIGAVELKNATTDDRALISDANTARTNTDHVLTVQQLSAAGTVPPAGDTATTPVFAELTDGTTAISGGNPLPTNLATVAGTTTSVNNGNRDAGTLRVTIADNDTNLAILSNVVKTHDDAIGTDGVALVGKSRTTQAAAVTADNDAAQLVVSENGELVIKGHTWTTNSNRSEEIDPVTQHYSDDDLADTTNINATAYYPSSTGQSMGGYRDLSFTGKLIDADGTLTWTLEGTNDEDTAAGDWIDVTSGGYRPDNHTAGNASIAVTNGTETYAIMFDNFNYRYYRVKVTQTGNTNTVIVKGRRKGV